MMSKIFAIDPGNIESGYVLVEHDGTKITRVLDKGKIGNYDLLEMVVGMPGDHDFAVEMVASYGMAVGAEVFETCVWIGRYLEATNSTRVQRIYRRDEKLFLCGNMGAKDSNIAQALVDRFAPGEPNRGKGTKKEPGFFYGFSKDMWAAMAVATTYFDKYIRGMRY
jgi:hypothetical protein